MQIREAAKNDLFPLLELYTQLHDSAMPPNSAALETLWSGMLADKNHHVIIGIADNKAVSSCVLVVVPNLTRNQRPYAFIENVITHEAYRGRGCASAVLGYAREIAVRENCYKIMLMTGSKQESTFRFYEKLGYSRFGKTAFIQWNNMD